ncbi:MAG: PKD domain-containing protein [Bacteroidota bacterium]
MKKTKILSKLLITILLFVNSGILNAQLKADFKADILEGCSPLVVNFTNLSSGNPVAFKWDLGNNITSTEKNPGIIYIKPGVYSIKLVISNVAGEDSVIKNAYINVYGLPEVLFSTVNTSGCAPFNTQIKSSSNAVSGSIAEYVWDFGDGQISKEAAPVHTYTFSDSFDVTLSVINSHGCKQSLTLPNFIYVPPTADAGFNYTYTNVCQPPAQINFANTSASISPQTYSWNFGDGGTSDATQPVHTFVAGGNYTMQLIAKTALGCADTATRLISIGSVMPSFEVPDSVCTSQLMYFHNTSFPEPINVNWSFGDGNISTNENEYHAFATSGIYNVTLNADFGNCNGTFSKIITVTDKPKASFTTTGNPGSCTMPTEVQFNNTSTGAVSYKWIFGDGSASTLANPLHTYHAAGFYSVSLIAFNSNGCSDTITYKDLLKTGPPQVLGFQGLPVRGCAPYPLVFNPIIQSSAPVVSYSWNFGDGSTSTAANPQHVYQQIGVYKVSLTIKTSEGCSSTFALDSAVVLGATPISNFIAYPFASCASLPISFFDKSSADVDEWLWFFGDGGTSTATNPTHMYQDTGYFNITLIAKNNNCSDTLFIPKYIQIFPPIAKFDMTLKCDNKFERKFIDKSIGATTWEWKFGDGATSTIRNPTHTYSSIGRYGVSLKVTNGECEYIKYDSVFIVDENPSFTYDPEKLVLCKNNAILFRATNFTPSNLTSLYWNLGDSASRIMSPQIPELLFKYKTEGTYNPMLVTEDINGCLDTVNRNLSIKVNGPTAAFTNQPGTCLNNTVLFTDKSTSDGTHPIVNYTWWYGDNKSSNDFGNTQHTYTTTARYNIKLAVIDSYGCTDTLLKTRALSITQPVARFSVDDSLICSNNNVSFTNESTGSNLTYAWSFGDGNTSVSKTGMNTYLNAGVYNVSLSVRDAFGCKDKLERPKYITVSNPQASFTLNDTLGLCPPLLIEPLNTSKNFQSIWWEFGDATNTNLFNPQHYYGTPGTFNLKLIAKGYGNCYDTAYQKIILKGPSGTLNYSTLTGCVPTTVAFSSTSKNVAEYVWDFNNGVIKHTTDSTVKYNYTQYGSYLPKLVLIDAAGCKVSVENKDRIVISGIDAGIKTIRETLNGCDSTLRVFADSSKVYFDVIKSYQWNFGDNTTSADANPSHYYNKPGIYNVSLAVTSKLGCRDTVVMPLTIKINKSPVIALNYIDSVCETLPVKFFANNLTTENSATTWQWNFGDGNSSLIQNPVYTYTAGGLFKASIRATAENGCIANKLFPVSIFKTPVVFAGVDTALCLGNSVTLSATGAATYIWKPSSSLSCLSCAAPVVKANESGWYYATGKTVNGCVASDSVFVKVYKPFQVNTSASGRLCLGQSVVLKAEGSQLYEWTPKQNLDNPFSANPVFKPTSATEITYTVIGKDTKNCFSDTGTVTMKVYPIPAISIIEKNVIANAGYPVQLKTISSSDIIKWQWSPVLGLDSSNTANPFATPKTNITYTVVASNEGGCSARDQVTISVICDGKNIIVPNTFSPNNDAVNERFFPRGKGIFNIKSFRVFNRWGQVVFEKMNGDANLASEGWDGTFKGKPQPLDVYVYMMEVVCDNGTVNRINGNVTLLR